MAEYLIQGETLNQIADAIRAKTGEEGEITLVEMPEKIEGIKGLWEQIQDGTLTEWVDDEITEMTSPIFYNNQKLTKVSCNNLKFLSAYAFSRCTNLKEINLPNLITLEDNTNGTQFGDCFSLQSVTLPEVIAVPCKTFYTMFNLIEINLSKATKIDSYAIQSCPKLTTVNLPKYTGKNLSCSGGWVISHCEALENLVLPSFIENTNITLIAYCSNLKTIDLPVLSKIPRRLISNCPSLKSLILRNNKTVTLALSNAFENSGIDKGTAYIYVPAVLIEEYKSATNWSTYATQFRALEDYTVDGTITGELDETKIAEAAE